MEINEPWNYTTYKTRHFAYGLRRRTGRTCDYPVKFETLKNYSRSSWKLGDIVKFSNGYYGDSIDWQLWFYKQKELEKYLEENFYPNRAVPVYARNQIAILLARYKLIKDKGYRTFTDYGSIIMMLTGDKVGHIRRYYTSMPFDCIDTYPYNIEYDFLQGVEPGKDVKVFLKKLVEKISK